MVEMQPKLRRARKVAPVFAIAAVVVIVFGYVVGKDLAFRDDRRDEARPEAQQNSSPRPALVQGQVRTEAR